MKPRSSARPARGFGRLTLLGVGIVLCMGALIARLFSLQVLRHEFYAAIAEGRAAVDDRLIPVRGNIFFRDSASPDTLLPLATNRETKQVYAVPRMVQNPEDVVAKLQPLLTFSAEKVRERLARVNDAYVPIARDVPVDVAARVEALALAGIRTSSETSRYYPFADLASQLTGFVGYKDNERVGQYGVEGYLNERIAGKPGHLLDPEERGTPIGAGAPTLQEAIDGDSVVLTIDRTVQYTVCTKLEQAVAKHGAEGGTVIIVNPKTGAIVAMCSTPGFDANRYAEAGDISVFTNPAVSMQYEPGSVMKAMTLSAGLDAGVITPDSTYTDTGSRTFGKYTVRNAENKSYGEVTMATVLEQSINTGAIHVAELLGRDRLRDAMEQFGFGAVTGVELQGEFKGNISALSEKGEIFSATASFGQGISVTPLQLVMAYAAIANGGTLMRPYMVDEMISPDGEHQKTEPRAAHQVLSASAARTMMAMLVNVVRKGHGQRAAVPGFYVGGKTGTAQIPYQDRAGYDPSRHIGTFVGFASMSDPRFVMITQMVDPKDVQFAESSAAPLWGDIAKFLVNYYRMAPDDTVIP